MRVPTAEIGVLSEFGWGEVFDEGGDVGAESVGSGVRPRVGYGYESVGAVRGWSGCCA